MINILKLRKLQKEKATAGSKPAETVNMTAEAGPAEVISAGIPADNHGSVQSKKTKKPRKAQTAAPKTDDKAELETVSVATTEPLTEDAVTDEPVVPEDIREQDENVHPTPETAALQQDAIRPEFPLEKENGAGKGEVSSEDMDKAELLRLQLINELMNDQNYNQPPAGEEDQNAEREMLMMLMEENKKKREVSGPPETAAAEANEEPEYKNETGNVEEKSEPSEAETAEAETAEAEIETDPGNAVPPETQPEIQYVPAAPSEQAEETEQIASGEQIQAKESAKGHQEVIQLVSFELGRELYGVDIIKIREINRMTGITKVPRAPEFIEGVINLRGSVIPVINLRTKVKMPRKDYDKDTRIIVMDLRGFVVGFIVDAVREVLRIPENLIVPPPDLAVGKRADYITAVAKLSDKLVILMEPERILSAEENRQLQKS